MTARIGNRSALTYVASVAMAETRIAVRAAPAAIRYLAPIAAWAAATIILGIVIGLTPAAVIAASVWPFTGSKYQVCLNVDGGVEQSLATCWASAGKT